MAARENTPESDSMNMNNAQDTRSNPIQNQMMESQTANNEPIALPDKASIEERKLNENEAQPEEVLPEKTDDEIRDEIDERRRKFKELVDEKIFEAVKNREASQSIDSKQTNSVPSISMPNFRGTALSPSGRPVRSEYRTNIW